MSLLENLFSPGTIERLGWMLVHFLWQATAVAVLLAGLLRLMRRTSAKARYAVACGALALMVVLPLITMHLVEVPGPAAEAGPATLDVAMSPIIEQLPVAVETVDELAPLPPTHPLEAADLAVPVPWRERIIAALEPALPYVVLGWLVGVFGLSAWHLGGWTQLHRLKRRMTRHTSTSLRATLDELAATLGVRRAVTLLESAIVEVPTVVGWLRPVILLPASALTGLSPDQLRAILAHELAHIRRYDYFANIVQTVVEILGFYHPAVWWVSTRIRVERENCCDDLAVQTCGNSLQYARALTSMEEIRHSRSDLAMAASGGSLMARIARLLGRPAVDDRRFAWLPGLIALLLVTCIIIPAALVLAEPGRGPMPSAVSGPGALLDEPPRTQVLMTFSIIDGFADRTLDLDTAIQARSLLTLIRPTDVNQSEAPTKPPAIEELLVPLRGVFARFGPIPLKSRDLADLLVTRGYATRLSAPKILTFADEPASIRIGNDDDSNASDSQADRRYLSLTAQAHVLEGQNAVRLSIDYADRRPIGNPDDPNAPIASTEANTTVVVPDGQSVGIVAGNPGAPDAQVRLVVVGPINVITPQHAVELPAGMMGGARTIVESPPSNSAAAQDEPQVLIDFVIAKALPDAALDRETLLMIGNVLAVERPEVSRQIVANPKLELTLGELLKTYVTGQSLSSETNHALVDLLCTRGFIDIRSRPKVTTFNNEWARIETVSLVRLFPPSSQDDIAAVETSQIETQQCGAWIDVTPHVRQDEYITLDVGVKVVDLVPQIQTSDLPKTRVTEVTTTLATRNDRSSWLLVEPTDRKSPQTDVSESLLVMFKPEIVRPAPQPEITKPLYVRLSHVTARRMRDLLPAEYQEYVDTEITDVFNPNSQGHIMKVTGPTTITNTILNIVRKHDISPPLMLLDVRVVTINYANLLNLGVEWSYPRTQPGGPDDNNWARGLSAKGLSVGYSVDSTFTDSLVQTLNLLQSAKQAEIVSNPQVLALDGRTAGLRSILREWVLVSDISTSNVSGIFRESGFGTTLRMTPRIGDNNDITIEVAVEADNTIPKNQVPDGPKDLPADVPIVTRRQARNTITVQSGGTVAVAGLTEDPVGPNGKPREIAIFVTAYIVGPTSQTPHPIRTGMLPPAADGPPIGETLSEMPQSAADTSSEPVLLTACTVVMTQRSRLSLPVQWTDQVLTPSQGADRDARRNPFSSVRVGLVHDRAGTDSVMAALRELERDNAVDFVSDDWVLGHNGQISQVNARRIDEWYMMGSGHSDAVFSITPHLDDNDSMTLGMGIEVRTTYRSDGESEVRTFRLPDRAFALSNGGTIVLVDATEEDDLRRNNTRVSIPEFPARPSGKRELLVFLTALPVHGDDPATPVASSAWRMQASSFPRSDSVGSTAPSDGNQTQTARVRPRQTSEARQRYVNADPLIREMSAQVVRMERDLIVSRQTLTETHPEMVQKKAMLKAFKDKLQERRSELEQKLDSDLTEHPDESGDSALRIVMARQAYVNADPMVQELTATVVEMEKGLITLRQTVSPSHQTLRQRSEIREALERRLNDRRAELEKKFDAELKVENSHAVSPGAPPTSATSTNIDLLIALAQISKQSGVKIAVDLTVKPHMVTADLAGLSGEAAIRKVLEGTPYTFRRVPEADPPAYVVYHPIVAEFQDADLLSALQDIAAKAGVPIHPDPNMSGKVTARIENTSLEEALALILAGTPYLCKQESNGYIVTDRRIVIDGPSRTNAPQVHVTATLATVLENQRLDRDTATEVFNLIVPMGDALHVTSLSELRASTVGQILNQLGTQIPADRFRAVLQVLGSKKLLENIAEPQMIVPSGKTGEMMGEGQAVKVHVEVMEPRQTIQLNAEASMQVRRPLPPPSDGTGESPSYLTSVRKAKGSGTLEIPNDRHGLLALGGASSATDPTDAEMCYLILHPVLTTPDKQKTSTAREQANEDPNTSGEDHISLAWTIMRYPNCPPLLLGLTQQFAKVLTPSRRDDSVWKDVANGGTLRLKIDAEGDREGEVLVGLFADARWLQEPVAVRCVTGSGEHVLKGLPAGRYQIGAMVGTPPVAAMLGVQRQWPQAVEIEAGRTATAEVLVSKEFQQWASRWYNEGVSKDYLGDWSNLNQNHLLQGRLLGPDGRPIRFGEVQIREHKDPSSRRPGVAAPDVGTNEQGYYRFDGMTWPYTVAAMWRDPIPSLFGSRSQFVRLHRVMEGPQQVDFRFKPFPTGTAKVAGRVIDQTGEPVKGFFLRVTTPPFSRLSETPEGGYDNQVTYELPFVSEDGRFELAGLPDGPAQVYPLPFEIRKYEMQWGRETTLAAGDTTMMDFELVRPELRTLYGRVLFEDGTPAVPQPAPWPDATTRVTVCRHTFPVRAGASADLDADGYFAIELRDSQYEQLASGEHQLGIGLPNPDRHGWRPSGEFPFDKLADNRDQAGIVRVKRLMPAPTFQGQLGPGTRLPPGWRLDRQNAGVRSVGKDSCFNASVIASNTQSGLQPGDLEFVIYDPNAKEVSTFHGQSMMIMPKAQPYRLIARRAQGGQVAYGPFLLDMTQPDFYYLTIDLSAIPEADSKARELDATPR